MINFLGREVHNLDSNNVYVKLYQLAQKLDSLEDQALHQSAGKSGITILGRGVLADFGSQLTDLTDSLLLDLSDVSPDGKNGDYWQNYYQGKVKRANDKADALVARVDDLKSENQRLKEESSQGVAYDAQTQGLVDENNALHDENAKLREQLAQANKSDSADKDELSSDNQDLELPTDDDSDDDGVHKLDSKDLLNQAATDEDQAAVDSAIDGTPAATDSAEGSAQPASPQEAATDVVSNLSNVGQSISAPATSNVPDDGGVNTGDGDDQENADSADDFNMENQFSNSDDDNNDEDNDEGNDKGSNDSSAVSGSDPKLNTTSDSVSASSDFGF